MTSIERSPQRRECQGRSKVEREGACEERHAYWNARVLERNNSTLGQRAVATLRHEIMHHASCDTRERSKRDSIAVLGKRAVRSPSRALILDARRSIHTGVKPACGQVPRLSLAVVQSDTAVAKPRGTMKITRYCTETTDRLHPKRSRTITISKKQIAGLTPVSTAPATVPP